jgi:cobyrinic acid a,c-diamide synthase
MTARIIIVAAPRSGSGKTTITLGLLRAFRRRGLVVRAAKAGPDYIDPAFHAAATGTPSVNLDSWAMPPELLGALLANAAEGADLLIVEGAMGLFDGVGETAGRRGAAADLAARFGIPVALVLDVTGQGQTVGAVACGFVHYDPTVRIAGVIANRVASARHRNLAEQSITGIGLPLLGALMRDGAPTLPERHLGLVQAREHDNLEALLESLADSVERDLDLDAIFEAAGTLDETTAPAISPIPPPGRRIAMAWDEAFSFAYPHMLHEWRAAGAEVILFSPLADEAPAVDCDSCWLPGGYPELHAGTLAEASNFLTGLHSFAQGRPVHGECGGFMVLGQSIEDAAGTTHRMAGLMGHRTSFAKRKLNLGYRQATLLTDCPLGSAGTVLRGHEFHYATITPGDDPPIATLVDGLGNKLGAAGGKCGSVTGTFFHAIARQQP